MLLGAPGEAEHALLSSLDFGVLGSGCCVGGGRVRGHTRHVSEIYFRRVFFGGSFLTDLAFGKNYVAGE